MFAVDPSEDAIGQDLSQIFKGIKSETELQKQVMSYKDFKKADHNRVPCTI